MTHRVNKRDQELINYVLRYQDEKKLTDDEVAGELGIHPKNLYYWRNSRPKRLQEKSRAVLEVFREGGDPRSVKPTNRKPLSLSKEQRLRELEYVISLRDVDADQLIIEGYRSGDLFPGRSH